MLGIFRCHSLPRLKQLLQGGVGHCQVPRGVISHTNGRKYQLQRWKSMPGLDREANPMQLQLYLEPKVLVEVNVRDGSDMGSL